MVSERAATALKRIERALVRIESATVGQAEHNGSPAGGNETGVAFAQLERRHAALRHELTLALADIDQLISHSDTASS